MTDAQIVSVLLGAMWLFPFYFGVRHKHLPTILVALYAQCIQAVIASGEVTLGRALSIPWVLALGALLVDRLNQSPKHIARVAAAQVEEARRMAHERVTEAAAKFARELAAERKRFDELERRLNDQ